MSASSSSQLGRLVEDRVGDEDLADVVQLGGPDDGVQRLVAQADVAGEASRELGDGAVVARHARDAVRELAAQAVGRLRRQRARQRAVVRAAHGRRPLGGASGARERGPVPHTSYIGARRGFLTGTTPFGGARRICLDRYIPVTLC
jgi:hypothetical protein